MGGARDAMTDQITVTDGGRGGRGGSRDTTRLETQVCFFFFIFFLY
jgi:hypothetical protein